jgi:hypothetical protein
MPSDSLQAALKQDGAGNTIQGKIQYETMNRLVSRVVLVLSLLTVQCSASSTYFFQVAVIGNSPPGTDCANLGESLGPTLIDQLVTTAPWLQPYTPPTRRYLKASRKLSVNFCSKSYCSRRANFNWCYFNGCSCTCGHRRMLYQSNGNGNYNGSDVVSARQTLRQSVADAAATIPGCELALVFAKVSVDNSQW